MITRSPSVCIECRQPLGTAHLPSCNIQAEPRRRAADHQTPAEPLQWADSANQLPLTESDLVRCMQRAIAEAKALGGRPQRPMITGTGFEPEYREYQRRYDQFSCFVAVLCGSLSVYAPAAAAEINAFLDECHADAAAQGGAA